MRRCIACLLLLSACGGEEAPTPPSDPPETATDETTSQAATTSEPSADETNEPAEAPPPAPPATVDLLHAVPSAISVSSSYQMSPVQAPRLVDGDLETAWNSETGQLENVWIQFRVPAEATVTAIEMTAGFTRVTERADLFEGNHRVARVRVRRGEETIAEQALDTSERGLQTITLETPAQGGDFRVQLVELQAGSREDWREACVSELRVMGRAPDTRPGLYAPQTSIGALRELGSVDDVLDEPVADVGEAGGVYFGTESFEVFVMGANGRARRIAERGRVGIAPDGAAWLATQDGQVRQLPSGASQTIPAAARHRYFPPAVAVAPNGAAWIAGDTGAAVFENGSWTTFAEVGEGVGDVGIDADGTVWLVARDRLYRREGEGFTEVARPDGASVMFRVLRGGRHLFVRHRGGLLRREGDGFTPVSLSVGGTAITSFARGAIAADGTLVASHVESASLIVKPASGAARRLELDGLDGRPQHVSGIAFDGSGRLWMFANAGLYVFAPNVGEVLRRYPPGTIRGFSAGHVEHFAVAGEGPATLPDAASRAPYRVTGRFVYRDGGEPLAGVSFELCTRAARGSLGSMASPCDMPAGDEMATGGTTRADGTFDLYGIPPDVLLDIAVPRRNGRWYVTDQPECCFQDRNRPLDLGTIRVP